MEDVARYTLKNLKNYRKQHAPPKPIDVPPDQVMIRLLQKRKTDQRINADEREILNLFSAWRSLVWQKEDSNAANLQVLFSTIKWIEEQATSAPEDQAKKMEAASKRLRQFIHDQFGKWPPKQITNAIIRGGSSALACEMQTLNKSLRYGEIVE